MIEELQLLITFLGYGTVAFKHVFRRRKRRHFSGVEGSSCLAGRIVDCHEKSTSNPRTLRIDRSDAKERRYGGVYCIAAVYHHIP